MRRETGPLTFKPDYKKVSAYFNIDNGTGKLRGIYCQENAAVCPIFQQWLEPFKDLGVTTVSMRNTGSTDHVPFDAVGVPGFQFIQDPVEYFTPSAIVSAASALIDAHCNRPTLAVAEYTERQRISPAHNVRLTYLPLTNHAVSSDQSSGDAERPPAPDAPTPFIAVRMRYAANAREATSSGADLALAVSQAFSLAGSWFDVDPLTLDFDIQTGEVTLPVNILGLAYAEAEFTYHAGFAAIPNAVKIACAHIVRSALATPALNVRAQSIERMHMEYFADSLLTPDIRKLLAPYVARRV